VEEEDTAVEEGDTEEVEAEEEEDTAAEAVAITKVATAVRLMIMLIKPHSYDALQRGGDTLVVVEDTSSPTADTAKDTEVCPPFLISYLPVLTSE
jgi:hypothetical protein